MWKDVLKNQIQVGRQKLRTDDQPLPEDEEEDCKRKFMYLDAMIEANKTKYKSYRYNKLDRVPEEIFCKFLDFFRDIKNYRIRVKISIYDSEILYSRTNNIIYRTDYGFLTHVPSEDKIIIGLQYDGELCYELEIFNTLEKFDELLSVIKRYA
tara:strand:- start:147 stop:605 length:459 start_codon:yes stop_codon:yes gene_type:complete